MGVISAGFSRFKAFSNVFPMLPAGPNCHGPTNFNLIDSPTEQIRWSRKSFGRPMVARTNLNKRSAVHK
jgi:hypothetical protein